MKINHLLTSVFLLTMSSAQAAGNIDGLCQNPNDCQYFTQYNQAFDEITAMLTQNDPPPKITSSSPINSSLLSEPQHNSSAQQRSSAQQKQAPISWY